MGLVNIKNNNKSEHGHEYGVINHFFTIIYFEEDEKYYITPSEKKNETKTHLLFIYFITMFQVIC